MSDETGATDAHAAIRNAHVWFESHSGWAPPEPDTVAEWAADGVCRCPDECLVAPDGWCAHGLASWALILDALAEEDAAHAFRPTGGDGRRRPAPDPDAR